MLYKEAWMKKRAADSAEASQEPVQKEKPFSIMRSIRKHPYAYIMALSLATGFGTA